MKSVSDLLGGVKIHKVNGDFICINKGLTSLEGSPEIVKGHFVCFNNKLTNLKGSPEIVEGDFYCTGNELTSLKGIPKIVKGSFNCSYNSELLETYGSKKEIIKYIKNNCKVGRKIIV